MLQLLQSDSKKIVIKLVYVGQQVLEKCSRTEKTSHRHAHTLSEMLVVIK